MIIFLAFRNCLFVFNVFSLFRIVWYSFPAFLLLDLWVILTLEWVLSVPCSTLAYVFWNPVLCLVGWGFSSVVEFPLYFQIIELFELSLLHEMFHFWFIVFDGFFNAVVFFSIWHIFQLCFCILDVILCFNNHFVMVRYNVFQKFLTLSTTYQRISGRSCQL